MTEAGFMGKKFLIDGFPKNQDDVDTWESEIGKVFVDYET